VVGLGRGVARASVKVSVFGSTLHAGGVDGLSISRDRLTNRSAWGRDPRSIALKRLPAITKQWGNSISNAMRKKRGT